MDIIAILIGALGLFFVLLPALIAWSRTHPHIVPLAIANAFFALILIGMAVNEGQRTQARAVEHMMQRDRGEKTSYEPSGSGGNFLGLIVWVGLLVWSCWPIPQPKAIGKVVQREPPPNFRT